MLFVIKILLAAILVVLIIYSKVTPHRDQLSKENGDRYVFIDRIISPILMKANVLIKPVAIGVGIYLDMSHIVIMVILILAITIM